jgi:coenzyme Q-binding protein COQ10
MRSFEHLHRVPHSAQNMFDLVADVDHYPEFVPLCRELRVRSRTEVDGRDVLVADMTVAYKLFRESFTSRVTLDPGRLEILVEYLSGPFRHLENRWKFTPVDKHSCEVDFFLAYEFKSRSLQLLMGSVFETAFSRFADAFERRADEVYGRRNPGTAQAVSR